MPVNDLRDWIARIDALGSLLSAAYARWDELDSRTGARP